MAAPVNPSYAIAGSGDVDVKANAAPLLDDYLPRALGAIYRPANVPRSNKTLSGVIDWLESEDVLGPKGTVPSDDLIKDLLERRKMGAKVELIIAWPADPSKEELDLVKSAFSENIPVKNLSAALDDLDEDEIFPPEPEPEPEPAAAPAESDSADKEPAPSAPVPGIDQLGSDLIRALKPLISQVVYQILDAEGFDLSSGSAARRAVERAMAAEAREEKPKAAPAEKPKRGRPSLRSARKTEPEEVIEISDDDTPPFDGPYKTPKFQAPPAPQNDDTETLAYYHDTEKDTYRPARARPRRGERRVMLTLSQINELAQEGKIPA